MKYDIFLSHCREDKTEVAFPLYRALEALGFNVWIDRNEIVPGDEIYENITAAVRSATCVIAVIAKPYLERNWTQQELRLALEAEQNKINDTAHRIFPIYHSVTQAQVNEVFPFLQNRAYEKLETERFDPENACGHTIIDRIILWYFTNNAFPFLETPQRWLMKHLNHPYINQLYQLYRIYSFSNGNLRSDLLVLTNAIRYLLAVLSAMGQSQSGIHYQNIALKYCTEIANYCFKFERAVTYDMLLACQAIFPVLCGDLKALFDAG